MSEFEWDHTKAQNNLAEHGVSFEAAQLVFDDEQGEVRLVTIGMVKGVILTVVHTERR